MPPKNMISVTRNSHMPSEAAFFCCCASENWWTSAGLCASCSMVVSVPVVDWLSCNGSLQFLRCRNLVVVIGFPRNYGGLVEVKRGRWRGGLPLQTRRAPGIGFRDRPIAQGPQEVDHRQQIAHRQNA